MSSEHHLPDIRFERIGLQKLRTAIWRSNALTKKTPLLFFNGVGANLEIAQPLGDLLRDRDVITFDLPGIGGSPKPVAPYRPWWVAYAARQILKRNGYDIVDVMGVSWGGGAAQQFAFQYMKRVNKLILAATSPGVIMVPGDIAALSKMSHPMRYTNQDYLTQHFETLYGDEPGGAKKFAEHMKPPTVRGYLGQLTAMAGWTALPFLPFLPQETLILAGDKDKIVPIANAHILKFMIPNSQMYVFKDGGHLFMLSRAEEMLSVMTDFLDNPAMQITDAASLSAQPAL
ncbi:MAG: poly(3-hydroxyalkanoic acid) depolymerase [Hyphococcus sp.]|nr:MAG: poly(3-hydroxyalkanoic acid) depolymerase [Marinicaulis sp.]